MSPRPASTLIAELRARLRETPGRVALELPGGRGRQAATWTCAQLLDDIARLARGLHDRGLRTGEAVLFLSENDPRWIAMDLALLSLGCPDVPRGTEAPADEIEYIVRKVRARVAVVQSPRHVSVLRGADDCVQQIVLLRGSRGEIEDPPPHCEVIEYAELLQHAEPIEALRDWCDRRIDQRTADETATVVFTSGTTGRPKGVVLRQSNLAANLGQTLEVIDFLHHADRFLSILPPWHMFERLLEYALLSLHLRIVYTDRRHFAADVREQCPDVLGAVPRLWVMLMDGVMAKARSAPPLRRAMLRAALSLGAAWVKARRAWSGRLPRGDEGTRWARLRTLPGLLAWPLIPLSRWLVLDRVARALGLVKLRHGAAISGGGSLPEHVDLFLESLGARVLNGYGLTETSPLLAVRLPRRNVVGTVGPPVPGTQIEIRDPLSRRPLSDGQQGVIHVRGPQVMSGYWEDPEATAKVLDADGWFDTGDLGRRIPTGELQVTGRAKDTIVLLSGENIEPEPLENALTQSPLIAQAVVLGQDQKYLGALIVPDHEQLKGQSLDTGQLVTTLRREISEQVSRRRGFRSHESIARFHVVEQPFCREDGSMSQTLKVKRNVVQLRYEKEIRGLFEESR